MREITVVTTFHKPGLDLYAQKFLNSFHKYVDKRVKMIAYAEDCNPINPDPNQITIVDHHATLPKLVFFKDCWRNDPRANGQGPDIGSQYRSIIFYQNDKQKLTIISKKETLSKQLEKRLAAEIMPFQKFWIDSYYYMNYVDVNALFNSPNPPTIPKTAVSDVVHAGHPGVNAASAPPNIADEPPFCKFILCVFMLYTTNAMLIPPRIATIHVNPTEAARY